MSYKTVIGVFDDVDVARSAVEGLFEAGFTSQDVSLLAHGESHPGAAPYRTPEEIAADEAEPTGAGASGAATGGALGGVAGLLLGIGFLSIPGVGPVVVAGPIAATLVGAVSGAVMGGLMGVLMEVGVPEDDASLYTEALRRGSVLVAVMTPPERIEATADILRAYRPVDLAERALAWKSEGWGQAEAEEIPLPAEPNSHEGERPIASA